MKLCTRTILLVAALLAVTAVSSIKRMRVGGRAQNSAACCTPALAPDFCAAAPKTNHIPTNSSPETVIAYYFHGTIRCETCLLIEALARAVIEQQFGCEMAANRLSWQSVNYDSAENRHFVTDFKLPCPSLVLVAQHEDKPLRWKLLGDTWQLVHEPDRLTDYVATEVRNFLSERGQPLGTNSGSPDPPDWY